MTKKSHVKRDVFPQLFCLSQIMLRLYILINKCSVIAGQFLILEPVLSSVRSKAVVLLLLIRC